MWDFFISHFLLSVRLSSLFLNFDVILVLTDTQGPKSVFFHSSPCLFSFFTSILRLPPCPPLILIGHKNSLIPLPRMFFLRIPEGLSPTLMLLTTLQTPLSLHPRLLCPLLFTFWHNAFQHTTNILFVSLHVYWQLRPTRYSCASCVLLKGAGCRELEKYSFVYPTRSPGEWLVRLKKGACS